MRPIKLEIEGLNSFENRQVINFESVGKGVFGIFGKTGSGKSTILDAITLALYGDVERSKQNLDFINTKRKKTVVSLDFEVFLAGENKYFSVIRSFIIKKNGKDVESNAIFYEIDGDEKKIVCEGAIKVNDKILEIVGLGRNEFVKCIALPQGEFSAFLKARQSERTEILSNIFDLSKYGDELYRKVKDKVNEYEKDVIALNASLSIVDHATDSELESAKEKYDEYNKNYSNEKSNLSEKSKLFTKLSSLLEKKKKLEEINKEYDELFLKSDEMKTLEKEIEKNQNANSVKADFEKLQKTIKDEKNLSEKIAEIDKNRLEAEKEFNEANEDFDSFKTEYTEKTTQINSKLSKIKELLKYEEDENSLKENKSECLNKIELKNAELTLEQEKLGIIISNLNNIEETIENIDEFIKANKSDVDLSYALEQTKGIESEIILIDDFVKNLEFIFDETNENLSIAEAEYDTAIRQEKKLNEKIDQIQNSISVAFEDIDKTNFNKIRSCDKQLDNMKEANLKASIAETQINKLIYDKENRQANIVMMNEQIEKTQISLENIDNYISGREKHLKDERERREELFGGNFFSLVSNQLKIGDDCPICGSRVIQKSYEDTYDLNPITNEIKSEEMDISQSRAERDRLLVELSSLQAKNQLEREIVEIDKREIDMLSKSQVEQYAQFVEINNHSKENFQNLFNLLSETSENLEKLIDLQDMLREQQVDMIVKKTQFGVKITIYKEYIEAINDILYNLKRKKAERELAILNVNEEYKNLKEYKKQIAEGKNIELIIDEKKEERYSLKDKQTKLLVEKSKLEGKIAELSAEIAVLNEKVSNISGREIQVREVLEQNGISQGLTVSEENKLLFDELHSLEIQYGKKETQVEASRELLSRKNNEFSVNSTILNSKQSEISSLKKSVEDEMEKNHFENYEELESYFTSSSDVKEKQNIVNVFKAKFALVENQKRELEVESYDNVSDENVSQLKLDVDLITTSVQQLSEMVGRQTAEYEKLEAENKKRKQILKELQEATHNLDTAKELASVLKGKALAEYVAEEFLQEITFGANQKLNILLDGRYTLKFENKEFVVEDNFNDGMLRSASTLSGGETFLVSLSLAFAISDSISLLSSRSMDFFFLDEGFGTLDSELCEVVVSALYKLESHNMDIGLISHVAELEESIKNRILVTKTPQGSRIKIEHSL